MPNEKRKSLSKEEALKRLTENIKSRINQYVRLFESARLRSIESEGRNQTRYDTQKVETGYEADAYSRKIVEARNQLAAVTMMDANKNCNFIELGALAEIEIDRDGLASIMNILFVESVGGIFIDDIKLSSVSVQTPAARALWGKKEGDSVIMVRGREKIKYKIIRIC